MADYDAWRGRLYAIENKKLRECLKNASSFLDFKLSKEINDLLTQTEKLEGLSPEKLATYEQSMVELISSVIEFLEKNRLC